MSNSRSSADAIDFRPATAAELRESLQLLLGGPHQQATDEQMVEFISASQQRGIDLASTWIASRGGRVIWSLLPVISPGKTMLVLSPNHPPPRSSAVGMEGADAVMGLINCVCGYERNQHGIELAQMLIDPADVLLKNLYLRSGFIDLAELIYLQRTVRRLQPAEPLPLSTRLINYTESNHPLFIETIRRSYADSLDCPALNGLRSMEDVLLGHKHSGEFDPSIWFVLLDHDQPKGVMLLSRAMRGDAVELVYLGLTPEARGRGWADRLMQLALVTVVRQNKANLTLAVDSRNVPALKLYQRHGLSRLGSRRALIQDLRIRDLRQD